MSHQLRQHHPALLPSRQAPHLLQGQVSRDTAAAWNTTQDKKATKKSTVEKHRPRKRANKRCKQYILGNKTVEHFRNATKTGYDADRSKCRSGYLLRERVAFLCTVFA